MRGCKFTSRLSALSMALAFGVITGLWMMLFALYVYSTGHGTPIIAPWIDMYPGYEATVKGSFIGAGYGFVEGFIFGLLLAWVYNFFLMCCRCCCSYDETERLDRDIEIK